MGFKQKKKNKPKKKKNYLFTFNCERYDKAHKN